MRPRWMPVMVLLALGVAVRCSHASGEMCAASGPRVDCGWLGITANLCEERGCCWSPVYNENGEAANGVPWCYQKSVADSAYKMTSQKDTDAGFEGQLDLISSALRYLGPDTDQLRLTVSFETESRLHVKITDWMGKRWQVPESLLPRLGPTELTKDTLYDFSYQENPFGFSVVRKDNGEVLFNTSGNSLFFKDQYLEVTSPIPASASLYGFGERTGSAGLQLPRNGVPITIWNKDTSCTDTNTNLYGSHPFLLDLREGGNTHGVFLMNSNGMDVVLTQSSISYRILGGVLDFYFFLGPTPREVLQQYQEVIGKPVLPPRWSLGFHQCRWGYKNVDELRTVVSEYAEAGIPLEVMWTDIDCMDGYRDFTLDKTNFPLSRMRSFVDQLHEDGQRWVPIIDPGIKVDPGYPAYDEGIQQDVFLKDTKGRRYVGKVWPGAVHFPDWFHPNAQNYWTQQLKQFHDSLVPFDGIWIDMNEASNFCSAPQHQSHSVDLGRRDLVDVSMCSTNISLQLHLEYPPYGINNAAVKAPLSEKTIPVSIVHHDGSTEYDAHNLYSFGEAQLTYRALENISDERPFLLTRSTFAGSGRYTTHWSGDNSADWNDLRWSIGSILNSNLFGIAMAGSDICGFNGVTNEELCARWISLGAFYPFTRAHSNTNPQELYLWPEVASAARKALIMRMKLIPYLFTSLKEVHTEGGAFASPLWVEFPKDPNTYTIHRQFLLGKSLLVSPVLDPGCDTVDAYIPEGTWYNIWNYEKVQGPGTVTLPAPLGEIQVHLRAGTVLPVQQAAKTTGEAGKSPLHLVIALTPPGMSCQDEGPAVRQCAAGSLYMDAGKNVVDGPDSFTVQYDAQVIGAKGRLVSVMSMGTDPSTEGRVPNLEGVTILGMDCGSLEHAMWRNDDSILTGVENRLKVTVNGKPHPPNAVLYDARQRVLKLVGVNGGLTGGVLIEWGCGLGFPTT